MNRSELLQTEKERERGRETHKYSYFSQEDQHDKHRILKEYFQQYEKNKGDEEEYLTAESHECVYKQSRQDSEVDMLKKQNNRLRLELELTKQEVEALKGELFYVKSQIVESKEKEDQKNERSQQMKQWYMDQLQFIAEKNRQVDQEIAYLRLALGHSQNIKNYENQASKSIKKSKPELFCHPDELEERVRRISKQTKILQQFANSVNKMYYSIVGHNSHNLQQLWRWLKGLAHSQTNFRQWKTKTFMTLQSKQYNRQKLLNLIEETLHF